MIGGEKIARHDRVRGRCRLSVLVALLLMAPCTPSVAQDAQPQETQSQDTQSNVETSPASPNEWHFTVAPYAWAVGIEGDVGARGRESSVNATFLDIVQDSDSILGAMGHVEAQYSRFGMFFDGTYADITASVKESAGDGFIAADLKVDVDTQMAILEAGAFYRAVDRYQLWNPPADLGGGTFTFDALTGVRYTYLGTDVDAKLDINQLAFKKDVDGSTDWFDPFVGGRVEFGLSDSVDFLLRGDVGGFGVGSDFTWNTQALLGYRFTLFGAKAEAFGGYRALGQDYRQDSGNDFKWDVVLHGPVIGMAVTW